MTVYDLYLESGPKRKKTMVHVLALLGCTANGPTTEQALANTPSEIERYRRFLHRIGERIDLQAPVETRVAQHITEGEWLGNGSPSVVFDGDLEPVTGAEIDMALRRLQGMRTIVVEWIRGQPPESLDMPPAERGRPARAIHLHVLGATGSYLSSALGSAPGFGRIHGAAERGELDLAAAFERATDLAEEQLRATTPEQWAQIRELPSGPRSLRRALRRMLEHEWEHLAELARRPGGPSL
jgi:hypothetical protein